MWLLNVWNNWVVEKYTFILKKYNLINNVYVCIHFIILNRKHHIVTIIDIVSIIFWDIYV